MIFVDTSGILAILDQSAPQHQAARDIWLEWIDTGIPLVTSNYVVVETQALVQNRLGMEAAHLLQNEIVPLLHIHWVWPEHHERAVNLLLVANRRQLSLVDCVSFVVMRAIGLEIAFAFDRHFAEQGFTVLPELKHAN